MVFQVLSEKPAHMLDPHVLAGEDAQAAISTRSLPSCLLKGRRRLRNRFGISFGDPCFQVGTGIAKFARAHSANFVGCRPATLLASVIASRESVPR